MEIFCFCCKTFLVEKKFCIDLCSRKYLVTRGKNQTGNAIELSSNRHDFGTVVEGRALIKKSNYPRLNYFTHGRIRARNM